MSKDNKSAKADASKAPSAAPASKPVMLKVGKPPRIAGHTATKNGKGGTAGTWDAIKAHMDSNGGQISRDDLTKICTEQGDSGFARYAQGRQRQWLVPVQEDKKS